MIQDEPISIHKAEKEEALVIHDLAKIIWPKAFEQILSPEQIHYMMELMYSVPVLEKEMERGVEFYLLKVNGDDMGYTALEKKDEHSYKLHKIYLSQKLHGKGIGKQQLKAMEEIVQNYGARFLYLNVNRKNRAIDFYTSQGYKIVKLEDIDIGNGYFMNDYVMVKNINYYSTDIASGQ